MAWSDVLGHEHEKQILQRAIIDNRIPHAYCFWGMEGIGKEALAIEFAKTVNCISPLKTETTIDACGKCSSCQNVSTLSHINLSLIFSLPTGKSGKSGLDPLEALSEEQISDVRDQIQLKAADPYHKISLANANQIKINAIRQANKNLSLSSNGVGRRCLIVVNAEEMTSEAANAFLKTLEEPHDNVTIIMTSSRQEVLLQTILSRCQQIHCGPIPDDLVIKGLIEKYQIEETNARLAATFAQGSFIVAKDMLSDDMKNMRAEVIEMLRASMKKNIFRVELLTHIDALVKDKNKNNIQKILSLLLFWMRDVYKKSIDSNGIIINIDQEETIAKFAKFYHGANILSAVEALEVAMTRIKRNVNPQLVLITLFLNMRQIFIERL